MSILMPTMSYDPFNSHSYASALFDPQDHYLQPAAFSPTASYAPTHPFPVDPRWFNNTSLSGHHSGAVTAPLQFSHIEHSDINHPHSQTDQLALSPSSTLAPIPPLSGFRNRSRSMSNRPRSLTNSSSFSSTRQHRRQTGPVRGASTNNNNAVANTSTPSLPVSPSLGAIQAAAATIAAQSPTPYMSSPSLPHSSSQDEPESRAPKRRRLTNDTPSHLHVFQSATGLTEPPQPILSPTHHHLQQQHHHQLPPLHVTHIHGHHHLHDFAAGQTWAGPPTSDHLPHGVHPDQHGYPWAVGLSSYYSPEAVSDHQHHQHLVDHSLPGSDVSQPQLLPYPSPSGVYLPSPASPALDTPNSALSTSHFPIRKLEPDSPILLAEAPDTEAFEHSPTEFPPRPYPGGPDAKSPWTPVKHVGKIYGSRLEQMPAIETRLAKLEDQLDHYLDVRAAQSLKNSQLPGLNFDNPSIQFKPTGPCRVFGGRIWPTALARRVRRTPRD